VVCSDPDKDGSVAIVNFTEKKFGTNGLGFGADENCVVHPGDHPFIKKPSVMAYMDAKPCPISGQKLILSSNAFPRHARVSDDLLSRIMTGALKSDDTKQRIQQMVKVTMDRLAAELVRATS